MEICQRARVLILCLCLFILPSSVQAAADAIVVLPKESVIDNDYFVSGKNVEISGTVNGDLYVIGGQVFIDGIICGDIIAAAGTIQISGTVKQDVRLLAGQASVSGNIERSLTGIAGTLELSSRAVIGNNAVVIAASADLDAQINNQLHVYASSVRISGNILGNLLASVGQMRIASRAHIWGELEYWSNETASIDSQALITKGVTHHPSFFYQILHGKFSKILKIGSKFTALLMNFLYTLVIALIMMRYFPQRLQRCLTTLDRKPLQALIAGGVLVFLLPIALLVLIITILGMPFALTLLSLTVVSFYTAKIFAVLWVSKWIFRRCDFYKYMRLYATCGFVLYFVAGQIPYVGIILSSGALLLGLGGGVLSQSDKMSS